MSVRVVLLGHHTGYSASAAIHTAAFEALGIEAELVVRDIGVDALPAVVDELRGVDYLGANVTEPHARAVTSFLDRRSADVERLGAATTLVHLGAELIGYNTDLAAMREELAELRPHPRGSAVVLAALDASAAAVAALEDLGWEGVRVINQDRSADLRAELADASLVVNAIPSVTAGADSPIPTAWLRPDLAVLDLGYEPSPTHLVRAARAIGAPARGGAGVVLRQATASIALWTGLAAPIEQMRAALHLELGSTADA
jgi:shikimate dehydrogenase